MCLQNTSRVNYIDNLRSSTVSLLIIYHLAMAYNTWGEANYIFFEKVKPLAFIVVFISPWFMPLMFLLAGIGTFYSLQKRSFAQFIKERLIRLGVPLVFGFLFINPILSYVADVTHNGFCGNYFKHYGVYFKRLTDLSGYDGGLTLGHLWFIAVLIIISIAACPIIGLLNKPRPLKVQAPVNSVLALTAVLAFNLKIFGKPLITYACVFLLGYCFFSSRQNIEKLVKYKRFIVPVFLAASITNALLFVYIEKHELLNNACSYLSFVLGVPALLCLSYGYLNWANKISRTCARLSYVFYIVHFPIVVLCQYFVSLSKIEAVANFAISFVFSTIITCALCLLIDTNSVTRFLFGLKMNNKTK